MGRRPGRGLDRHRMAAAPSFAEGDRHRGRQPERAARAARNAAALGTPDLAIVQRRAPAALAGLPAPDAVFIGGGLGRCRPVRGGVGGAEAGRPAGRQRGVAAVRGAADRATSSAMAASWCASRSPRPARPAAAASSSGGRPRRSSSGARGSHDRRGRGLPARHLGRRDREAWCAWRSACSSCRPSGSTRSRPNWRRRPSPAFAGSRAATVGQARGLHGRRSRPRRGPGADARPSWCSKPRACRRSPRPRRWSSPAATGGCSARASRPSARPAPSPIGRRADDGAFHRRRSGRARPDHGARPRPDRALPGLPLCRLAGAQGAARSLPDRRAHRRYRADVARRDRRGMPARDRRRARTWRGCIRAISRSGARWASSFAASTRPAFPTP